LLKLEKNSFGCDHIYLAIENQKIIGLTIIYTGGEIDKKIQSSVFSENLEFFNLLKLLVFEKIIINRFG
jgi:hypothetical protein